MILFLIACESESEHLWRDTSHTPDNRSSLVVNPMSLGSCLKERQIGMGASHPDEREWTTVRAYPVLAFATPLENWIAPGDPATVELQITAACGPLVIEGFSSTAVWESGHEEFLIDVYEHEQPASLENLATNSYDEETSTASYFGGEVMSWGYNFISYSGFFAEEAVEYIPRYWLREGETVTYRFTFTSTAYVPVGEKFRLDMHYMFWREPLGSNEHYVASTAPEYMPDGGLEWNEAQWSIGSAGSAPAVVYYVE